MTELITRVQIRQEPDVVYARQRARLIAAQLGFDRSDQTRLATAVSEIARNALQHGGGGEVEFALSGKAAPQIFAVTVRDRGPGVRDLQEVLAGRFTSRTGMGLGIAGTRRLVDHFHVESRVGEGTTVFLGKPIPETAPLVTPSMLEGIARQLMTRGEQDSFAEIRQQNLELLRTIEELQQRQEELRRLNRELEDTNRGIVALYEELNEKAEFLARSNELKARFLSNMSHEFRTPLNSILALSRLLLDRMDGELTAEQEKQVQFIRQGAEELSSLVNDLLDLAKLEAGKTVVNPRKCSVEEIFSGLRGMMRPMLTGSAVELIFDEVPHGMPPLFTDEGKVSQILRNFISNAVKFTERGTIRVSSRLNDNGKAVLITVTDTGPGIAPQDQRWIFEDYTQLDQPHLKKIQGTGLGLPIARRLAEMLGGRVGLESRPGAGSTFWTLIPVDYIEATQVPEEERDDTPPEVDVTRLPVMVVEDDPATQLLYEKYLKGSGFQTLPAHSVAEARRLLGTVKPFAILLDILLQGEDAWQFLTELKGDESTRNIPVLVISILEEEDRGLALGAEDYCVKPVERRWLLRKLRGIAGSRPLEKVLIIDDEEVSRYLIKGLLADTKYRILEAADGPSGLRAATEEAPDVIFLDLMMPGMSGFEVLQELKRREATRLIPVIITTSKTLDEEERRLLFSQAVTVLAKEAPSREAALLKMRDALQRAAKSVALDSA